MRSQRGTLRSAGHGDLLVPTRRFELGERVFSVYGPKVSIELEIFRSTVDFI
jgi:hypothetical protein